MTITTKKINKNTNIPHQKKKSHEQQMLSWLAMKTEKNNLLFFKLCDLKKGHGHQKIHEMENFNKIISLEAKWYLNKQWSTNTFFCKPSQTSIISLCTSQHIILSETIIMHVTTVGILPTQPGQNC